MYHFIKKVSILIVLLFTGIIYPLHVYTQCPETNDKINQRDSNGKKHGYWIKKSDNGNILYKGCFRHGEPVDTLTRFYPNTNKKAEMFHQLNSDSVDAILYFKNGKKAAEGIFVEKKKEGVWRFYSKRNERIVAKISYNNGMKDGKAFFYHENGRLARKNNWKEGEKHGIEKTYYETGKVRTEFHYKNGTLHGGFHAFTSSGTLEITGKYVNGKKEGKWKYYDTQGNVEETIVYQSGVPENQDELVQDYTEKFDKYYKNRHNQKSPRELFRESY